MGFLGSHYAKDGIRGALIGLLMTCVRSVSYSILIDGQPHGHIIPTMGVRQGDPLSSYFFILCAEAMSSLLHFKERSGLLSGIPIGRSGISINHLFFADDSLLFVGLTYMNGERSKRCFRVMGMHQAKRLIEIKLLVSLVEILIQLAVV